MHEKDKKIVIGIDASRSIDSVQKTGVEKVSDELLKQFVNFQDTRNNFQNNNFEFIFYTPQKISWLPDENQRILKWRFKFLWTQIRLAWELIANPPDVVLFPVHAMPLVLLLLSFRPKWRNLLDPSATPPVGGYARDDNFRVYKIIHDIAFKKEPKFYSLKQRIILNLDLFLAKKICTKIFVPTNAVKDDLVQFTKIQPERIVVSYWGYTQTCHFDRSLSDSEGEVEKSLILSITEKRRLARLDFAKAMSGGDSSAMLGMTHDKKQILYIGRIEEKKNIANLIQGFEIFNQKFPDYKLVLAGEIMNYELRIKNYANIEFLGYVSEEKKQDLLKESACLAFVSKQEGFGFPILEAFDFGLPVITSDIPVLKEVGGGACIFVNPDSTSDIAVGLEKITQDENLRNSLIQKGRERLKDFSWQKTAEVYLKEFFGK